MASIPLNDDDLKRVPMGRVRSSKRGKRRHGRALGMNMATYWRLDHADKVILNELSKVGRDRL